MAMQITEMKKFEDHIVVPFVAAQTQKLAECPMGKIPQYAANLTMVSEAYRQAMLLFKGIWLTDNPRYAGCDIKYVIQHLQSGKRYPNLEIPNPQPQTPPVQQTPPKPESQPAPQTNQQTPPVTPKPQPVAQQNAAPQPTKQETPKQGNAPTGANATATLDLVEEAKRQADAIIASANEYAKRTKAKADKMNTPVVTPPPQNQDAGQTPPMEAAASNPVKPDEPQPEPDQQNPAPESQPTAETQTPDTETKTSGKQPQTPPKQKQPKKRFIAPGVEAPDDWDKMTPAIRCRYIEAMHNPQLIGPKVPDKFANMSTEQKIDVLRNVVRFGTDPTNFHPWQIDAMLAVFFSDAFKAVCVKYGCVNAENGVTAMQIKRGESTIGDKDKRKYNFFVAIELESQKNKDYVERDFLQIGIKTVPTYKKDTVDVEWVPFVGKVLFQDDPNKKP